MKEQKTILLIHGLFLHTSSWDNWLLFFQEKGYKVINPGYPGDLPTVKQCRENPSNIANKGLEEIVSHYSEIIAQLPELPIVIGHSLGGLIAQILLSRNLAVAGIAIDPAPMKGVKQIPLSSLKASFPIISNPFNVSKSISNTYKQFRYGFANAISEREARALYEQWTIPAPCRPVFQVALANISGKETQVDTRNTKRGPLLITAGEHDHHIPPVFSQAALKRYNKFVITDYKLFENRGHSLTIDSGWNVVAEYLNNWLIAKNI